ncbi:MAG: hypothetical protein RMK98_04405, partial [Bacteroidia bacterium]|nr:hypothetical protein [Bacteroidia bacterium]
VDYAFQQVYPGLLLRLYEPPDHLQPWSQGSGVLHFSLPKIETYFIEAEDFAGNQSRVRVTLRTHSSSDTKYLPLGRSWTWSIEQGQLRVSKTLRTRQGEVLHPTQPLALNGKLPDTLFSPEGKGIPTWLRACIVPGFSQKVGLSVGCTLTLAPECLRETLYCRVEPIETPWGNGFLVGDPLIPLKSSAQLRWELPLTSPHLPKTYPIYRKWWGGVWSPVTGAYRRGSTWYIPVRGWGAYVVMIDTLPPKIRYLRSVGPYHLIWVEDVGSGIQPYSLRVESEKGPILPEYYEPQRLLYLPRRAGKRFRISVSDKVGNSIQQVIQIGR